MAARVLSLLEQFLITSRTSLECGSQSVVGPTCWGSPRFDSRLVSFESMVSACQTMVFLSVSDMDRVKLARRAGCRMVLIPRIHSIPPEQRKRINYFDAVICPNKSTQTVLAPHASVPIIMTALWDQGAPLANRDTLLQYESPKTAFFLPIDKSNSSDDALDAFRFLREFLRLSNGRAHVTVSYVQNTWPKDRRKWVFNLLKDYPDDVSFEYKGCYSRYLASMNRHDVVVWPARYTSSAHVASESAFAGKPIIAYDLPEIGAVARIGYNGLLVGCDLDVDYLLPVAKPNVAGLVDAAMKIVSDPKLLRGMCLPLGARLVWRNKFELLMHEALKVD